MLYHYASCRSFPLFALVFLFVASHHIPVVMSQDDDTASIQARTYNFNNLDTDMKASIASLDVRGASIAFFDKYGGMAQPVVRGYGRIASGATSPLVTGDTPFMLASVSKVVTATVVLKLIDLGIISGLDSDICAVVPTTMKNTTVCRNPYYPNNPVTWRMLLTHRSTLQEEAPSFVTAQGVELEATYAPTGGYGGDAAGQKTCPMTDVRGFSRDILIDKVSETIVGRDLGVDWFDLAKSRLGGMWRNKVPGDDKLYSNFAMGHVAALAEWALIKNQTMVAQRTANFANFSRHYIFQPLGMNNTAWFKRDLPSSVQVAMPVESYGGGDFENIGYYCFIDYTSGNLFSSAADLAKFLRSMLNYGVPALWSNPAIGRNALNCQERNSKGQPILNCQFGINWILMKTEANETWVQPYKIYNWTDGAHHDGSELGAQTQILVLPKAGVYAVVLTNTDGNDDLAPQKMAQKLLQSIYVSG